MTAPKSALIVSASSDIGLALARHWLAARWRVTGTYRSERPDVAALRDIGATLARCDLSDPKSIDAFARDGMAAAPRWDVLALLPGDLDPVGPFAGCDVDEWDASIYLNFTGQLRLLRHLLPHRNLQAPAAPTVLFFAGGGANNAPVNYSAYTVSKIALTKMCELLDAEIPDTKFVILGPGWVDTKIHQATFEAGTRAGDNLARTQEAYNTRRFTPMADVLGCCDWAVDAPRDVVSGRNFSVAHDPWKDPRLGEALRADTNIYKLRRHGNDTSVSA